MVDVGPLETLPGATGLLRVNARAWRAAFADILAPAALPPADYEPDPERAAEVLERSRSETVTTLLARDGGVVGFAEFRWGPGTEAFVDDGEAELHALYVTPERWGEGIGTDLLAAGSGRLPDSTTALKLQTFVGNDRGRAFYEARGFAPAGEHAFEAAGETYPTVVYARPEGGAGRREGQ